MKSAASSQPQHMITIYDTLQQLNYTKRPAFNALWKPKDITGIDVKATEKRRILGDEYLETVIKERPRIYMSPSVSLDNVRDKNKRELMINFIYKTTVNQAAKEVWNDFKVQDSCLSQVEELDNSLTDQQVIAHLPMRFRGVAKNWDSMQSRSFLMDNVCYDKKNKRKSQIHK